MGDVDEAADSACEDAAFSVCEVQYNSLYELSLFIGQVSLVLY